MFPVILVLSHTLTNTREKTQICMTDFWNHQNNLFEFCSHLTAGVQEEGVESKNLCLFTGVFSAFFSQNRRKQNLSNSAKDTLSNEQSTEPVKLLVFPGPLFATHPVSLTERKGIFLYISVRIQHSQPKALPEHRCTTSHHLAAHKFTCAKSVWLFFPAVIHHKKRDS